MFALPLGRQHPQHEDQQGDQRTHAAHVEQEVAGGDLLPFGWGTKRKEVCSMAQWYNIQGTGSTLTSSIGKYTLGTQNETKNIYIFYEDDEYNVVQGLYTNRMHHGIFRWQHNAILRGFKRLTTSNIKKR